MPQTPAVTKNIGGFNSAAVRVAFGLGVALCLAATAAHLYLKTSADYATGALTVLDRVYDLIVALSIALVALLVGYSLSKRFVIKFRGSAEKFAFSFLLGTGVVALLVLFFGLLGLLRAWAMTSLLVVLVATTARGLPELYKSLTQAIRTAFAGREATIASTLFIAFIAFVMLRTLTPPHVADELIYHLPVPSQFVQEGRIFPSYDNSLGNVPFLLHMIYALCLIAGSDIAAKLFSLFVAISTAIALYAFCSRFINRRVGVVAIFAFFASGMIVELAVTTRIDVSLAGMLFAGTYAMVNYLTTQERGWLWLSALFAGFSLGIKHTAALWIFFIGVLYLTETIRSRESAGEILRRGIAYTFIALALASPWYIKNAIWFKNPIYPFVTGEVATFGADGIRYFNADDERKLDAHFATARNEMPERVKAQEEELQLQSDTRLIRHPMRLWEFFLRPNAYLMAEPNQYPNYLFLIIPLIVFLKPGRWVWWLLILGLAFTLSVTLTSWIARYLVPAYPSLTIVAAYTLTSLATRLESRLSIARILPVYVLAGLLAIVVAACAASMRQFKSLHFVTGLISRHSFLAPLPFYQPIDFINNQLPENTRVMTIGSQMNYGLKRQYYADESWFATKWRRLLAHNDSLEGVTQELKARGFTHILYNPTLFRFAARMGVEGTGGMNLMAKDKDGSGRSGLEYQLLRNWSTFTLYKEKFLETVYSDENGYEVLRIK
jgi:Dolichyl-phosphate-mannose-protein mannosyltransferase